MDEPLTIWYCDICHEPIKDPSEGIIIWNDNNGKLSDFKIVHKNLYGKHRCDDGNYPSSMDLTEYLGTEGMVQLTSFLSTGAIHHNRKCEEIEDIDNFIDLYRRLQLPYYEEARKYFTDERVQDIFCDSNEYAPYLQKSLKRIINMFN